MNLQKHPPEFIWKNVQKSWRLLAYKCFTKILAAWYSFKNVCKNLISNQKQPSSGVLQNSYSEKFWKIHRTASTVECSFSKIAIHRVCFSANLKTFRNTSGQLFPNDTGYTKNLRCMQNLVKHLRWSFLRK